MTEFRNTRAQTEQKVILNLLSEIEGDSAITQRKLASEVGIALGLLNGYLKSCAKKGWIRMNQVSPRRITYFLTPKGFKEKSLMVRQHLASSLTFFRDARNQCDVLLKNCHDQGWHNIAVVGTGDLVDICKLVAGSIGINVEQVSDFNNLNNYSAVFIADIYDPQGTYDKLAAIVNDEQLMTVDILHITRKSKR